MGEFNPAEEPWCFVGDNLQVRDRLGREKDGRIPATWWTLNHRYNFDYELHRLNVADGLCPTGAVAEGEVRRALCACDDPAKKFRYRFVRDAPDIAVYIHALRAELHMRMVMPVVLGYSKEVPCLSMARFETGAGGNMHWHGVSYGKGNPRMDNGTERLATGAAVRGETSAHPVVTAAEGARCSGDDSSGAAACSESVEGPEEIEEGEAVPASARVRVSGRGACGESVSVAPKSGRPAEGRRGGRRGAVRGRGADRHARSRAWQRALDAQPPEQRGPRAVGQRHRPQRGGPLDRGLAAALAT